MDGAHNMSNNNQVKHMIDPDDLEKNPTNNPHIHDLIAMRTSRRSVLKGIGAASLAMYGGVGLSACTQPKDDKTFISFTPIARSIADQVKLADGYQFSIIGALGDPMAANIADYKNDGSDNDWDNRMGDHHDGMQFFGINAAGQYDANASTRGILAINHESTSFNTVSSHFIHVNGGKTSLPRPAAEVDKELSIHGLSFLEVQQAGGKWQANRSSALNSRVTQNTLVDIGGPLRGHGALKTKFDPTALTGRGTLNNCGAGKTPWGSYLSGEENWAGYFARANGDDRNRDAKANSGLSRYGCTPGATSYHGWETAGTIDKYTRFNVSAVGATELDDFRNEINTFGFLVEADPINSKNKRVKKRTAMGRFAHESGAFGLQKAGEPLAIYQGDDSRNEYIYKFVSTALWNTADANSSDVLATGDKYLDSGKLYVAKFTGNGTGTWELLSTSNPVVQNYPGFAFADDADVALFTRIAGDACGATKMDRPEWCTVHPNTGEVYFSLTNNSARTSATVDAANPRAYTSGSRSGNVNGHIIRLKEGVGGNAATTFTWDIYLFGAPASANKSSVNVSALNDAQDFSSPDGVWFSQFSKLLWILTDDSAYTNQTNSMLLAAYPGKVGDGGNVTINGVNTKVGAKATIGTLKRFLVGPKDSEITGITETPDGKTMFVNIQHPGENTPASAINNPGSYSSQWPSNMGYGQGKRPRSATIVITRKDGGTIGF